MSTWSIKNPFRRGRFYVLSMQNLRCDEYVGFDHFFRSLRKATEGGYVAVILPEESIASPHFAFFISQISQRNLRSIFQVQATHLKRFLAGPKASFLSDQNFSLNILLNSIKIDWEFLRAWKKKDPFFHFTIIGSEHDKILSQHELIPPEFDEDLHFYFPYNSTDKTSAREIYQMGQLWCKQRYEFTWKSPLGIDLFESRMASECAVESDAIPVFERKLSLETQASIVVPVYNNAHYILNTLRHLEQQKISKNQFQVVIVDDGSNDETSEQLLRWLQHSSLDVTMVYFPRLKLRKMGDSQFRAGLARNLGVKWARGEYLIFLDSDILVPPHFVEQTLRLHQDNDVIQWRREYLHEQADSVNANYSDLGHKDTFVPENGYWHRFYQEAKERGWKQLNDPWKYTCTYALSMKKSIFKQSGWFRKTYCFYGFEDTDLGWRLFSAGFQFLLHDEAVYHLYHKTQRSEFKNSFFRRQKLLTATAEIFYYNNLAPEIYEALRGFLRTGFFWR